MAQFLYNPPFHFYKTVGNADESGESNKMKRKVLKVAGGIIPRIGMALLTIFLLSALTIPLPARRRPNKSKPQ